MRKTTSFFLLIALLLVVGIYFLGIDNTDTIIKSLSKDFNFKQSIEVEPISEKHLETILTEDGIFYFTNFERSENNVSLLLRDINLDILAIKRLQDMFELQYFDHVSPTGYDIEKTAKDNGYKFITIGENIALGNFLDDRDLVLSWMNSESHRENIVSTKYTHIGLAVMKGIFEGKEVWLGVQIFGRPVSDCVLPNPQLQDLISEQKTIVEVIILETTSVLEQMIIYKESEEIELYNEQVAVYNSLVQKISDKLTLTDKLTEEYNRGVAIFNDCLKR